MSKDISAFFTEVSGQLRVLRETVRDLEKVEEFQVVSLRGAQSVDVDGALHLSFRKLEDQIAGIEETLAAIAEAIGTIPKL